MPLLVVLGAAAVASSVPLFIWSLRAGQASSGRVSRNLTAGIGGPASLRQVVLDRPVRQRALAPFAIGLLRRGRRATPAGVLDAIEHRLTLAGLAWPLEAVLAAKFVGAAALGMAGLAWFAVDRSALAAAIPPIGAAAGWLLPDALLSRVAGARQRRIREDLPDVLDQLTICVNAGLAFDAALLRVSRTGLGPLGGEITRVLQDLQLGIPRPNALEGLLARTDVPELRQFVHAINQADNYGVPVASVLRAQAAEQRAARYSRAEIRAQELPVKMVFPLVLCILPSLFIVVLGPAALRIADAFG